MDTPQVTPELLESDWDGADAVLGLSEDGGFWAIGLRTSTGRPGSSPAYRCRPTGPAPRSWPG